MQALRQIIDEFLGTPRQKLNNDPRWVVSQLKDAFALAVEQDCDELPHFKAVATHLALSFAILSDNAAPQEPPTQDSGSPEFRDWLLTLAVNALVLEKTLRPTFRRKFLEHAEAYLNN